MHCGSSQKQKPDDIVGIWEQWVLFKDEKRLYALFMVDKDEKENRYIMYFRSMETIGFIQTGGLKDITFNGRLWTFKSDWGRMGVATFKLVKAGPNQYVGYTYLNGRPVHWNIMIRRTMISI